MVVNNQSFNLLRTCIATTLAALTVMAPQAAFATPVFSADSLIASASLANSGKDELAFFRQYAGDLSLTPTKPEGQVIALNDHGQWYIDLGTSAPGYFLLKFGTGSTTQHSHYLFKNDGAAGENKLVWTNAQVNFLTGGGNCLGAESAPAHDDKPNKGGKDAKPGKDPKPPTSPDLSSCNIGRLSHFSFAGMMATVPPPNPPTDNPPTDNPPTDNPPTDNPPTDVPPTDIPEPGSLALAGLGLLALFGARKKLAK